MCARARVCVRVCVFNSVRYAPNGTHEESVIDMVVKDISCPKFKSFPPSREEVAYFGIFWSKLHEKNITPPTTCAFSHDNCLESNECWQPLKDNLFKGFATEDEALSYAMYVHPSTLSPPSLSPFSLSHIFDE